MYVCHTSKPLDTQMAFSLGSQIAVSSRNQVDGCQWKLLIFRDCGVRKKTKTAWSWGVMQWSFNHLFSHSQFPKTTQGECDFKCIYIYMYIYPLYIYFHSVLSILARSCSWTCCQRLFTTNRWWSPVLKWLWCTVGGLVNITVQDMTTSTHHLNLHVSVQTKSHQNISWVMGSRSN